MVFTLGSMIKNLSEEKSNMIASALAQIPQKVREYFFSETTVLKSMITVKYTFKMQERLLILLVST